MVSLHIFLSKNWFKHDTNNHVILLQRNQKFYLSGVVAVV